MERNDTAGALGARRALDQEVLGPGLLAARLRVARQRLGWSRETLAHHSGMSWSAITQIETGRRSDVRARSLLALADSLEVSVDYLVRGGAEPTPSLLSHQAFLYRTDDELVEFASTRLTDHLEDSEAVLVVTPRPQLDAIREALGPSDLRVEFHEAEAWYTTPSEAVNRFRSFRREHSDAGALWIRILAEPHWRGRSQAEFALWMRYESLLNSLLAMWPLTLICPYDVRAAPARVLVDAGRTHPELTRRGVSELSAAYEPPEQFLTASL